MSQTQDDLHAAQRRIVEKPKRFNVVNCGRRFGKTMLGLNRAKQMLRKGKPVGWFAPTYKLMLEVWQDARRDLFDEIESANKTEMRIQLTNGAVFDMWTLDNPDAGRGRKYARVIIDEAAMVKNLMMAWQSSIRPTLTDLIGDAWFLSTPKGRNGFWQLYQMGMDPEQPDWAAWQMPTKENPHIAPAEIEVARLGLPELVFSQEYLAEFISDSNGVFRRIMEAATATPQTKALPGRQYVAGIDWGKTHDFSVFTVIDVEARALVYLDRFNQIDYQVQIGRLRALCEAFKPVVIVAESNSIGVPIIEQLQRAGLPVTPFNTTNASKTAIIDALSLAFEQGTLSIIPDGQLIAELQSFEMERLPSGMFRYSAPSGQHDDCVLSLAMAWAVIAEPIQGGMVVVEEDVQISPY